MTTTRNLFVRVEFPRSPKSLFILGIAPVFQQRITLDSNQFYGMTLDKQSTRQLWRVRKREDARRNGRCGTCFIRSTALKYKTCEHCRHKSKLARDQARESRLVSALTRIGDPLCSKCLAREAVPGHRQCSYCQEEARKDAVQRRARNAAAQDPKCSNCFCRKPAPNRKYCEHCSNTATTARRLSRTAKLRAENANTIPKCSKCLRREPLLGRKRCSHCTKSAYNSRGRRQTKNAEAAVPNCTICLIREPTSNRQTCAPCRQRSHRMRRTRRQRMIAENPDSCRICFKTTRLPGYALCAHCRGKHYKSAQKRKWKEPSITTQSQSQSAGVLLSSSTVFPMTKAIANVMEIWYKNPRATMVVDMEYSASAFTFFGHEAVFQIAIADAHGNWIVPVTTINHHLSKQIMYGRADWLGWTTDRFKYEKAIKKFYGADDGLVDVNGAGGLTWKEIGSLLKRHTQVHGKFQALIEWGRNYGDYRCLHAGLTEAGVVDILPKPPVWDERPLSWWSTLRSDLGLQNRLDLSLDTLFGVLFPCEERLLSRAHNADADVEMTIRIVEVYLNRAQGLDSIQGIKKYIQRTPKWRPRLEFPTGTFMTFEEATGMKRRPT